MSEPYVKLFMSMDEAKALVSILDNVNVGPLRPPDPRVGQLNGNTRAAVILSYRLAADMEIAEKGFPVE